MPRRARQPRCGLAAPTLKEVIPAESGRTTNAPLLLSRQPSTEHENGSKDRSKCARPHHRSDSHPATCPEATTSRNTRLLRNRQLPHGEHTKQPRGSGNRHSPKGRDGECGEGHRSQRPFEKHQAPRHHPDPRGWHNPPGPSRSHEPGGHLELAAHACGEQYSRPDHDELSHHGGSHTCHLRYVKNNKSPGLSTSPP